MSIISDELYLFAQELQTFVSPTALQEIAKQVDFVQRLSKYHTNELIVLCAWNSQEIASTSLTQYRPFMTKKPIYVSFEIEHPYFKKGTMKKLTEYLQLHMAEMMQRPS